MGTKVVIRVEKDGKYVEKELTRDMVCAAFDLQFMLNEEVIDTVKLNNRFDDLRGFFEVIEFIDDAMHATLEETEEKPEVEWLWLVAKPEWKDL